MKTLALTTSLVLAALPAAAQDAGRVSAFLEVVEKHGCVVHETNEKAVLADLGMTEEEGTRIVMQLMSDGRAVPQGDDLRIMTGGCK